MLTVNDLEELETYMRSGELEADFKDGCENDRFYLLELLENSWTWLSWPTPQPRGSSSGACRCRRLPPNNSHLEQLALEMLVYGEKRPPTRISRQGFVCTLRRNGRRGSFCRRRICELYG